MKRKNILFILILCLPLVWGEPDFSKVIGMKKCSLCHAREFKVWGESVHSKSYKDMHKTDLSKQILKNLNLGKNAKREEKCQQCHYTVKETSPGKSRSIAGVSCERCHGPAKDWINIHFLNIEKSERYRKVEAAGMNRPGRLYQLGSQCYKCHTVADEGLIETGGHPTSDPSFNLLTWSQGTMRHTFLRDKGNNRPASPERRRVLYVVSQVLNLEYQLRGFAKATKKSNYATNKAVKLQKASAQVYKIYQKSKITEIKNVLKVIKGLGKLKLGQESKYLQAADEIYKWGNLFVEKYNGGEAPLATLDSMIPPESEYKGSAIGE